MAVDTNRNYRTSQGCRVALVGKMRSGKDTFAKVFIDNCFTELKFSEGITEIINDYFPDVTSESRKPREHYQVIGQALRQLDKDVWIKQLASRVTLLPRHADIIVTDVRQENEVKWLKEHGFTVIKVLASEDTRKQRILDAGDCFTDDLFTHETELMVDRIETDYTVLNEGAVEQLHEQAYTFIKELFHKESGIFE